MTRFDIAKARERVRFRMKVAENDVAAYNKRSEEGAAGYPPGGGLVAVKLELFDWIEGFNESLLCAGLKSDDRAEFDAHRLLRDFDPAHDEAEWIQDELIPRKNRWR